jgi:hypothetical protein
MIKLGYKASAEQFGPSDLLKFSCIAEEAGFDSVLISDHFQPRHTDGHAPFSPAWLGALGTPTSRTTLGTSVLTPTFRYHPSIVAQAFAASGCLYPGRVVFGIGSGESLNEVPSAAMVWPEFQERFGRLKEAGELMPTKTRSCRSRIRNRWSNWPPRCRSSGSHEQVGRLRPYIGLGFDHLVFHPPGADRERFHRLHALEVLPLVRKAFA